MKHRMPIAVAALAALCALGCEGRERPKTDGGSEGVDAGACDPDRAWEKPSPSQVAVREDGTAANFACIDSPEVWPQSMAVTMHGCLDVFGLGSRVVATTLKLAVFGIDQDPTSEEPEYGDTVIETTSNEAVACEKGAYYRLEGVPTSTPLLVKVWDTRRDESMIVVDSYQYGVLLDPADIEFGPMVEFDANVIYSATYTALPTTAGQPIEGWDSLTDGVGRAVIAGETKDCDGKTIAYAMVDGPCIDDRAKIIYTIGEDCDQPDTSLSSTSECGTYGILNMPEGWHVIEAFVNTANGVKSLGTAEVYVFPDSVTIWSPQGPPPQVGDVDAGVVQDAGEPDSAAPDAGAAADSATPGDGASGDA